MNSIRKTKWVFTSNNYDDERLALWRTLVSKNDRVRYVGFGLEVGAERDTQHLQGVLCFHGTQTLVACRKIDPHAHFEPMRASFETAVAYCRKDGHFEEYGEAPPGQGARTDIEALYSDMQTGMPLTEVSDRHFSQFLRYTRGLMEYRRLHWEPPPRPCPMMIWLFGPSGAGKSQTMKALVRQCLSTTYFLNGSQTGTWWHGYAEQKVVVMDDLRGAWMPHHMLLRVFDSTPFVVSYKGGSTALVAAVFIITTNRTPNELYEADPSNALARRVSDFAWVYELTRDETRVWSRPKVHGSSLAPVKSILENKQV